MLRSRNEFGEWEYVKPLKALTCLIRKHHGQALRDGHDFFWCADCNISLGGV